MVNELKLAVVHFTHQNPMQICACAWIYRWKKMYGKSGLGHQASGPLGHCGSWAVGRGPRAGKPSGRRAAGPSRPAVGWAAGLFLAKPGFHNVNWYGKRQNKFNEKELLKFIQCLITENILHEQPRLANDKMTTPYVIKGNNASSLTNKEIVFLYYTK